MSAENIRIRSIIAVFVGCSGILAGVAFIPSIFSHLFSMWPLLPSEVTGLYCLSILLVAVSAFLIASRQRVNESVSLVFFGILLLVGIELAARMFIVFFDPEVRTRLAIQGNRTYPQYTAYQGHPFLQFIGRPSISLQGNEALGDLTPFNNYGFTGPDFHHQKPDGVIRVIALGGSTTATGYPQVMEEFLNAGSDPDTIKFEVLNFGKGWYTSAHSVVNFILNIREFNPDYVVIHQGWNDGKARNAAAGFRTDYSHALTYFHEPEIVDKYAIRISVIYRYLKHRFTRTPTWASLDDAIVIKERPFTSERWQNLDELRPYERNIRTILDLAEIAGIKVVLTTQPHSTEAVYITQGGSVHIDQCNEIMRKIRKDYSDETLFVDLDKMMTGENHLYKDTAHVVAEGRELKAEAVGKAILTDVLGTPEKEMSE